jgi:hypothetical protein
LFFGLQWHNFFGLVFGQSGKIQSVDIRGMDSSTGIKKNVLEAGGAESICSKSAVADSYNIPPPP